MLAAQFTGKEYFELNELPVPECPEGGLLVKIAACAICGTDLKTMKRQDVKIENGHKRQMKLPRVTGHEISGTVAAVGRKVTGFRTGDAVAVAATIPCLNCESCRRGYYEMCDDIKIVGYDCDGGFAEYVAAEEKTIKSGCVIKLKEAGNLEAASLTEPLSCAVNCFSLTPVKRGDTVIVMGAGPLGCFLLELARIYGARTTIMTDIAAEQLRAASLAGADYYLNSSAVDIKKEIMGLTKGRGADVVITACPSPAAVNPALELVAKRGAINIFGGLPRDNSLVELDANLIHYKECSVAGTHGSAPMHAKKALEFIEEGRIDMSKYISHRFELKDINRGLDTARKGARLKILIKP